MRAQSYQTMAYGADTIQFFQLRRSKGACEKFHGAVIEHAASEEARVFREVAQLGEELERLSEVIPGSMNGHVFGEDSVTDCNMLYDIIHLESAETIAMYASDFYAGTPVVTKNKFGNGQTYYVGTVPNDFCGEPPKAIDAYISAQPKCLATPVATDCRDFKMVLYNRKSPRMVFFVRS